MQPDRENRKLVKHYHEPGDVHELTFSCYQRRPLLTNDRWRGMLSASLDRAFTGHNFRLAAFVFMPEHVHLLVYPAAGTADVSALLSAVKRPFAFQIKKLLIDTRSQLLPKLTIRERPGKTAFRFWQEGPGYDRNLSSPKAVLSSMDYIHANSVSRSLVNRAIDWRWSSARHYLLDKPTVDSELPTIHGLPAEYLQ